MPIDKSVGSCSKTVLLFFCLALLFTFHEVNKSINKKFPFIIYLINNLIIPLLSLALVHFDFQ